MDSAPVHWPSDMGERPLPEDGTGRPGRRYARPRAATSRWFQACSEDCSRTVTSRKPQVQTPGVGLRIGAAARARWTRLDWSPPTVPDQVGVVGGKCVLQVGKILSSPIVSRVPYALSVASSCGSGRTSTNRACWALLYPTRVGQAHPRRVRVSLLRGEPCPLGGAASCMAAS
jgi:hypothetical protein